MGTLNFKVETEFSNPIYRASLQFLEGSLSENNSDSRDEEELINFNIKTIDSKLISLYKIKELWTGCYWLIVEYKNFDKLSENIDIYPGNNNFMLIYPKN